MKIGATTAKVADLSGVTIGDIRRWEAVGMALSIPIGRDMRRGTYSRRDAFAFAILAEVERQGARVGAMVIEAAFRLARSCKPIPAGETWSPMHGVIVDAGRCWAITRRELPH